MKYLITIFISLFLICCSKKEYTPCDGNILEQDLLIYDTIHNPISSYFQYQLYDTLTFLDSIGNELLLVADFTDSSYTIKSNTDDCTGYTSTRHSNEFGIRFHHLTEPWGIGFGLQRFTSRYSFINNIPSYDHMYVSINYDNSDDFWKNAGGWIYPESNNNNNPYYALVNGVAVNASPVSLLRNDTLLQNMIIVQETKLHLYINTNYELVGFSLTDYVSPSQTIFPDINVCQWMLKSYW